MIQGATQLLQSHVIRNIFLEISARTRKEVHDSTRAIQLLAMAGYNVYQYGGFRGPQHWVHDWSCHNISQLTQTVIQQVTQKKHKQLNLWWKLDDSPLSTTLG